MRYVALVPNKSRGFAGGRACVTLQPTAETVARHRRIAAFDTFSSQSSGFAGVPTCATLPSATEIVARLVRNWAVGAFSNQPCGFAVGLHAKLLTAGTASPSTFLAHKFFHVDHVLS